MPEGRELVDRALAGRELASELGRAGGGLRPLERAGNDEEEWLLWLGAEVRPVGLSGGGGGRRCGSSGVDAECGGGRRAGCGGGLLVASSYVGRSSSGGKGGRSGI